MAAVAFYISAHQDDWQLFRGERAWSDVMSGATVVFVYVTAGDAGRRDGWWEAREEGALASSRLIVNQRRLDPAPPDQTRDSVTINGH